MSELQSSVASGVGELAGKAAAPTTLMARWYVLIMMCLVYTLSIADHSTRHTATILRRL